MVACPALLLWLALGPFAVVAPQEDPAAPRAEAQRILDAGDYQQAPPSELAGDPNLPDESDEERNSRPQNDAAFHGSGSLGFIHAALVVPIVVGVLLLLLLLLGVTRKGGLAAAGRGAQQGRLVDTMAGSVAAVLQEGDADPEALAAEGRFAEAIHQLLLRALRGLARSVGGFTRGLTSREIVPRAPDGTQRAALQELVAAVELHEFGAHELTAFDFERCRAVAAALPSEKGIARPKGGP